MPTCWLLHIRLAAAKVTAAHRIRKSHQCSSVWVQYRSVYMLGALSAPGAVVGAAVLAEGPGAGADAGK